MSLNELIKIKTLFETLENEYLAGNHQANVSDELSVTEFIERNQQRFESLVGDSSLFKEQLFNHLFCAANSIAPHTFIETVTLLQRLGCAVTEENLNLLLKWGRHEFD